VAAGIILSLDLLYRDRTERDFTEHKQLIADTIQYLERFQHNKIATRGVQVLSSLQRNLHADLHAEDSNDGSAESRKRRHDIPRGTDTDDLGPPRKRTRGVDISSVIQSISHNVGVTSPATSSTWTPGRATQLSACVNPDWHSLIDLLPHQVGFDSQYLFDNFC
jgi:hypothetical protein